MDNLICAVQQSPFSQFSQEWQIKITPSVEMIPLAVLLTSILAPSFLLHPSHPPHFYPLMPWWWGSWWLSKIMRVYLSFLPIQYPLKSHLLQKLTVRGSFLLEKKKKKTSVGMQNSSVCHRTLCNNTSILAQCGTEVKRLWNNSHSTWNKPRRVQNVCLIQICEPVILWFCKSDVLPPKTISDYIQPACHWGNQRLW